MKINTPTQKSYYKLMEKLKDKDYKIITVEEYLREWKQGDPLKDKDGNRCKIMGICGEIYLVSAVNDFSAASSHNFTKEELEKEGWELDEEDTEDKTKKAMKLLKDKGYKII